MLHSYSGYSADRALWEKTQSDYSNRFNFAKKNKDNSDPGVKANALLILSSYYRAGWIVNVNQKLADEFLIEAADLGHSRACYELARRFLEKGDKESALTYANKGLAKINDKIFDSTLSAHNQKSMEDILNGIKKICSYKFGMSS